jgi:hypothetical protein
MTTYKKSHPCRRRVREELSNCLHSEGGLQSVLFGWHLARCIDDTYQQFLAFRGMSWKAGIRCTRDHLFWLGGNTCLKELKVMISIEQLLWEFLDMLNTSESILGHGTREQRPRNMYEDHHHLTMPSRLAESG